MTAPSRSVGLLVAVVALASLAAGVVIGERHGEEAGGGGLAERGGLVEPGVHGAAGAVGGAGGGGGGRASEGSSFLARIIPAR